MMRRMLALAASATVAVLIGVPGAARAATVWVPASCATGSIDPVTVDAQGHYLLPAHMSLCEPYQTRFNYTIVLFRPGGYVPLATGDKLQSYRASGTANVIADVLPRVPSPVLGLCLMRDVATRTACVRIDTAADGTVTSTPIGVGDELVAAPVVFASKPPVNTPTYCASCVSPNW